MKYEDLVNQWCSAMLWERAVMRELSAVYMGVRVRDEIMRIVPESELHGFMQEMPKLFNLPVFIVVNGPDHLRFV